MKFKTIVHIEDTRRLKTETESQSADIGSPLYIVAVTDTAHNVSGTENQTVINWKWYKTKTVLSYDITWLFNYTLYFGNKDSILLFFLSYTYT